MVLAFILLLYRPTGKSSQALPALALLWGALCGVTMLLQVRLVNDVFFLQALPALALLWGTLCGVTMLLQVRLVNDVVSAVSCLWKVG